jgi:hypothetical protein
VVRFADRRRCHGGAVGCPRRHVGGGDGGDSRLESGEGMAEREGRRGWRRFQVGIWGGDGGARGEVVVCGNEGREGVGSEMVKAWCVGGEATGAEVFTYQVCSPLRSF